MSITSFCRGHFGWAAKLADNAGGDQLYVGTFFKSLSYVGLSNITKLLSLSLVFRFILKIIELLDISNISI